MNHDTMHDDDIFEPFLPPKVKRDLKFSPKGLGPSFTRTIANAAKAIGTHPRFLLTFLIVLCAGMLGTRTKYRISPSRFEYTSLHTVLIGPSGAGKSRPFALFEEPLRQIYEEENVGAPDHADAGCQAVFKARLKRHGEACIDADAIGAKWPKLDEETKPFSLGLGDYPVVVTSFTPEGLFRASVASKCGITLVCDEVADKFSGKNGTAFRDLVLKGYDQMFERKQLVKTNLSGIMAASLLGATVTERVGELGLDKGDGLTGRLLLSLANGPVEPFDGEPCLESVDALQKGLLNVRRMILPDVIDVDSTGWEAAEKAKDDLRRENVGAAPGLAAAIDRASGQIVRIAGAISVIYRADHLRRFPLTAKDNSQMRVSGEAIATAIHLFKDHYFTSLDAILNRETTGIAKPAGLRFVEALIDRHDTDRVSTRALARQPGLYGITAAEFTKLETSLISHGVATIERVTVEAVGRPRKQITLTKSFLDAYARRKVSPDQT